MTLSEFGVIAIKERKMSASTLVMREADYPSIFAFVRSTPWLWVTSKDFL